MKLSILSSIVTINAFVFLLTANTPALCQSVIFDNSFSGDGKVITGLSAYDGYASSVVVQNDGKILIGGTGNTLTSSDIILMRYNSDGTLDNSFDSDGILIFDYLAMENSCIKVIIQTDGKILIGGAMSNGTYQEPLLIRINSDGTIDNTFDSDGLVITNYSSEDHYISSIALQADGKIVVSFNYSGVLSGLTDYIIVRYNVDGSIDTSFDTDGLAIVDHGASDNICTAISLQSDGKIVASGMTYSSTFPSNDSITIMRFNLDGSLDMTFGLNGVVMIYPNAGYGEISTMDIQTDGKIVLGGYTPGLLEDITLFRFNTDGSLDNTFDSDGMVKTSVSDNSDYCKEIKIQPDGKIVVLGTVNTNGTSNSINHVLVRYNTDGSLDTSFDYDGISIHSLSNYADYGFALALQSDGKFITAGFSGLGSNVDFALARFTVINDLGILEKENNITSVFPNPTAGNLTISSENEIQNASLKITDISGKIIYYVENLSGTNFQIDLSNQPAGIYFLELNDEGTTQQIKLVKN